MIRITGVNGEFSRRRKLARALLKPINTAAIIILGTFTTVWGFWIANPFWTVFDRAALYSNMTWAPEYFWGGIAMIVGLLMIYGVLRNSFRSLLTGAKVGFYHWFAICLLFFSGDWQNTGGPTATMIAVYCGFVWLNIKVNKGAHSERASSVDKNGLVD